MKEILLFKVPLILAVVFLLPLAVLSQPSRDWVKSYNATGSFSYDNAVALAVDGSGNVLAAGTIQNSASSGDFAISRRDKDGDLLWMKKYNGPANGYDEAKAMAVDGEGNVYVTGFSSGTGPYFDFATVKYNKKGVLQWAARYNGQGASYDNPSAIWVDGQGNVYVTGNSYVQGVYDDYVTIKYDKNGVQLWQAKYNGTGNSYDEPYGLAVDAGGNVYVTGYSYGSGTFSDYATVKYDAAGRQQWVARYNGTSNSNDYASALALDRNGNVYVTGQSRNAVTGYDFATIKYSPEGRELWVSRYDGPDHGHDEAVALLADAAGNVFVTGSIIGNGQVAEYATIRYDAAGKQLWAARYNSSNEGFSYNIPKAIAADEDGNVYVTGWSGKDKNLYTGDFATIKYNASGVQQWAGRFDGPGGGWDGANALALDESGNVYVAGKSWSRETGGDQVVIKYAAKGTRKWLERESGTGNGTEEVMAMVVNAAGNVCVTGRGSVMDDEEGEPLFDYLTILYNSDGTRKWEARYNGPGNGPDEATAVAMDAEGNVYVTGSSRGSTSGPDFATVKYDKSGEEKWVARYNGPGNSWDEPRAIAVDRDGNVYVTGLSYGTTSSGDYATIKYNSKGVQQWVARYNGPGDDYDQAKALCVDGVGNVYVTGSTFTTATHDDYATLKYNALGQQQWVARYNGTDKNSDVPAAITLDGAGNVYVTGASYGAGTSSDYTTLKYNAGGAQQWVTRYNGTGNSYDAPAALAVDGSGNVIVTGRSEGKGSRADYATIKYGAKGQELWAARYNGPGNFFDEATAVAVDGAGNIYVTGESNGGASRGDFASLKYNAAGNLLWSDRFDGSAGGADKACAVALDGKGSLYVTGRSLGHVTGQDFLTIKYGQTTSVISGAAERSGLPVTEAPLPAGLKATHYPNPGSATVRLQCELPQHGRLSVKLFDMLGREVATITDEHAAGGTYGRDIDVSGMQQGTYYYRISLHAVNKRYVHTGKLMVNR